MCIIIIKLNEGCCVYSYFLYSCVEFVRLSYNSISLNFFEFLNSIIITKQFKFNCNNNFYYRNNLYNKLEFPRKEKQEQKNLITLLFLFLCCGLQLGGLMHLLFPLLALILSLCHSPSLVWTACILLYQYNMTLHCMKKCI